MSITLINAGPGSGKSFTIHYGYRVISNTVFGFLEPTDEQAAIFDYLKTEYTDPNLSVCYFAHNNTTKDNLIARLPKKTPVYTFHGAGQSALIRRHRFHKLDYARTDKLIADLTGKLLRDMTGDEKWSWLAIKKLVNYCKLENCEPSQENFNYIKMKYPDMSMASFPEDWHDRSVRLLSRCAAINYTVEFVDMLWLGMKSVTKPIYDLGFVDESQDISRCAYALVTRLCKNVVFCGDKNQAINAFAGASEEMYSYISDVSDAILPLKVSLRNPPFICDMANALRPGGVIYGPNPGPGIHETISYATLPSRLSPFFSSAPSSTPISPSNTLIISRTNAALISCAIKLHKENIPCRIIDKDLADEVIGFFKMFTTEDIKKLYQKIATYESQHSRSRSAMWVQMVQDKCSYARELLSAVSTWKELLALIKDTFEKRTDGYSLCSIHKSKGLEAKNIFILKPPIELACAMDHPIAREQEINLHFVALTRSAMNLYWVA